MLIRNRRWRAGPEDTEVVFVRPRGWQWAGQVQPVTMLGLSQLHTWWLMEGSCGVEIPNGSAAPAQRCRSVIPARKNPSASHLFSITTPVLCPPSSLHGSCCCGHPAQPSWRGPGRGDPQLPPDKGGRAGEASLSTAWAALSAAAPPIRACRGSAPRCCPSVDSGGCSQQAQLRV